MSRVALEALHELAHRHVPGSPDDQMKVVIHDAVRVGDGAMMAAGFEEHGEEAGFLLRGL